MDFMKAETNTDNDTCMVSADSDNGLIDIKEAVDPVLITFPVVKFESGVSCVFLVRNILQM
jgi:hypothetical protein